MDKVKQTLETFLREEDGQALTGRAGEIGLPLPLTLPKARGSAVPGTGGGDPLKPHLQTDCLLRTQGFGFNT